MKVVGISGTPRKGGNTECLVRVCLDEFVANGWTATAFFLSDKTVKPCIGCETCVTHGICTIEDDMILLRQVVADCDAVIIGSPVYYRNVTAQLKAVFDRSFADKTMLAGKPGGAIAVGRGEDGGQGIVLMTVYNYLLSCGALPVAGEFNGLSAKADKPGDIRLQEKRLNQARILARNVMTYAKRAAGKRLAR